MEFKKTLSDLLSYLDVSNRASYLSTINPAGGFSQLNQFTETLMNPKETIDLASEFLEDTFSIFHTSVPNIKLYYPEPFIATPTYIHEDLWFIHIVIYQYWLWFFFIYIIIFFFMTFLITVRWCNVRNKPARETRGVSRSKCGDLITATVPVSWATSIIIHESTDAVELMDGFGTTEMAIGIRAYQWGWEYYYPKDLNLGLKSANSISLGNSLTNHHSNSDGEFSNYFKSNTKTADIFDQSSVPFSLLYSKDLSFDTWLGNQHSLPGVNKLVAKNATNLITSQKISDFTSLLKTYDEGANSTTFNFFFNNLWEDSTSTTFSADSVSWSLLSTTSMVYTSALFSNLISLKCTDNTPNTPINYYLNFLNNITAVTQNLNSYDLKNSVIPYYIKKISSASNPSELSYTNENNNLRNGLYLNLSHVLNNFKSKTSLSLFNSVNISDNFRSTLETINGYTLTRLNLYADQDFKRWSSHELIEDLIFNEIPTSTSNMISTDVNFSNRISNLEVPANFYGYFKITPLVFNTTFNFIYKSINELRYNTLGSYLKSATRGSFFDFKNRNYIVNSDYILMTSYFNNYKPLSDFELCYKFSGKDSLLRQLNTDTIWTVAELSKASFTYNFRNLISKTLPLTRTWELLDDLKPVSTYYQAFWKIFKSNIEEERGYFNFQNYSRLASNLPIIAETPSPLLSLMQKKNILYFNDLIFFKKSKQISQKLNFKDNLNGLLNTFSLKFPFSSSLESDIIRYSWFDWYSVRSNITTKSIDTSVFGLNGVKQYDYSFSSDPRMEILNKADNFFIRYNNSRRLALPAYLYTPEYTTKFKYMQFSKDLQIFVSKNLLGGNLSSYKFLINLSSLSYNLPNLTLSDSLNRYALQDSSNYNSSNHNYYSNLNALTSQMNTALHLHDILAKREYILKNQLINTPSKFKSENNLYRTLITFTDSASGRKGLSNYNKPDLTSGFEKWNSENLTLKSQYQPMRKGIVNMIRIQADKAVAMPTDTRLQILAVSKDIIHSWSIPSAGIKIDCIPGYSSHRVAFFTLSGIYWGQCMEICGRFHHWMPIVVYFLRRDLFCMWCIHFVFNSKQVNNLYQGFDQNNLNYYPSVSAPLDSWSYELNLK